MDKLKIAFIGAGSRSFANRTFGDILLSDPLNQFDLEFVLMDTVAEHIVGTENFCHRAAQKLGRNPAIRATTDLEEAIEGADFVISAIEVNRYLYWAQDFHIPRLFGSEQIYGENGGPGGIFHALRNMGPTTQIAKAMERLCPDAWLLNFSNPESKLCEAMSRLTDVKVVGLCHGVFMGHRQIAGFLEMSPDDLNTAACGINHFTWFQEIKDKRTGEDLYPKLREKEKEADILAGWDELALGRILLRTFGLWPSPAGNHYGEYIRWAADFIASPPVQFFYDPSEGHPWETGKIPELVYSMDSNPTGRPFFPEKEDGENPDGMESDDFKVVKSGEVHVRIMEGMMCDIKQEVPAIIYPNGGSIPGIPDDTTVEMPATVDKDGLHPCQMKPFPEAIAAMIRVQGSIQKLLVGAFAERSRNKLLQTVLLDPTVKSYRGAVAMMNELLKLQKDLLPEFE